MDKLLFNCRYREINVDCLIAEHTIFVRAFSITKIELGDSIAAHGKDNQLGQANYSDKNTLSNALGGFQWQISQVSFI
jgi:hypothetical protein